MNTKLNINMNTELNLELKGLCKKIIDFYDEEQKIENIPNDEVERITNLRLQKILFFLYGFYWKETKEEILSIKFEAWQHGPVINELYNYLVERLGPRRAKILEKEWFKDGKSPKYNHKIFNKILKYLSQFSTIRLVNASHDTDPWLKTPNSEIIDNDLIKEWFEKYVPAIN